MPVTPRPRSRRIVLRLLLAVALLALSLLHAGGQGGTPVSAQRGGPASLTGIFVVLATHPRDEFYLFDERTRRYVRVLADDTVLRAAGGPQALRGRRVTVTGSRTLAAPATGGSDPVQAQQVERLAGVAAAAGPAAVTGLTPWIDVLCKFADVGNEPHPPSFYQSLLGDTYPGLGSYFRELSYNQVDLAGSRAVTRWYTLPQPESYYMKADGQGFSTPDHLKLFDDCTRVADVDVYYPEFYGINLIFNATWGMGAFAYVGKVPETLDGVQGEWATTWAPSDNQAQSVFAHEMGHGYGWPHSGSQVGGEYNNAWDVMASNWSSLDDAVYGNVGLHTIAYHKNLIGWIPPAQVYTHAGGSATITLEQLAQPQTSAYRIAQIPAPDSSTRSFTVEVRRKNGYDGAAPGNAVIIHEIDTTRWVAAYVIDADGNGDTRDGGAQWTVGETFSDPASGVSVKVESATATGFVVSISVVQRLTFTTQPGTAQAGQPFSVRPVVSAQSAGGGALTAFAGAVTVAIKPGTGAAGATLGGTLTRMASGGAATFDDLSISTPGSGYVLTATSPSMTSVDSAPFTVTAAATQQSVTFDDLSGQNRALNGAYPSGVADWGSGVWYLSGPWRKLLTKSVSFASAGRTSGTLSFVTPRRLVSVQAFNGGGATATLTLTCLGTTQPPTTVSVAADQLVTITPGWAAACTGLTLAASNGWDTNFDTFVLDATPDTTPPAVSSTTPAAGATDVTLAADVSVTFSEAVDPATVTGGAMLLSGPGGAVAAAVSYDAASRTATLNPASDLAPKTAYTATVKGGAAGVKDVGGNSLAADVTWSFTTMDAGFALTVNRQGTGTGTVTSTPAGITCGADCSESYPAGTLVRLTATPSAGSTFGAWGGDCAGAGASCTVTMDAARSVTAWFYGSSDLAVTISAAPQPAAVGQDLTYTVRVTNNGPARAGVITLTVTLAPGVSFVSAAGCAYASAVTCDLLPLASGASTAVTVVARPTAAGSVASTATVASGLEADPNATNNSATVSVSVVTTMTVTFDDLSGQNRALNGAYPSGVADWGSGVWYLSGPWRKLLTKSVSFASAGRTSGTLSFVTPRRLVSVQAFNGGGATATLTLTCLGTTQPPTTVSVAADQLVTITPGWAVACTGLTLAASNGWDTNFDTFVLDAG